MPAEISVFDPMKPIDIQFLSALMESRETDIVSFWTFAGHWFCSLQIVNGADNAANTEDEYLGITIGQGGLNLSSILSKQQLTEYSSWAELAEFFLADPWSIYNISGDLMLIDKLSASVDVETNSIVPASYLEVNERPFEGSECDEMWYSSSVLTLNSLVLGFESFLEEVEKDTTPPTPAYAAIEVARVFENGFKAGRLLSEIRKLTHLNTYYIRGMEAKRSDSDRGTKGGITASKRKAARVQSLMEKLEFVCETNPQWQLYSFEALVGVATKLAKKTEPKAWQGVSPSKGLEYAEDATHGGEFSVLIQSIRGRLA